MLRDADELLGPALAATVRALEPLDKRDAAVVRLAERYAALIDTAANLAAAAERILELADEGDVDVLGQLAALAARVERQTVLEKLGPKLLAALQQLQATPAARARQQRGGGDRADSGRLQGLRAARR